MICSQCPNATAVYLRGGMYYDCKSIRAMRARLRCNQHPPWQVQVYMDKIFVPRECPITNEGVKAKKRGSWSALYEATRNSYVEAACKVMGPAAEVVKPSFLEDALRWAVSFGHDEIIRHPGEADRHDPSFLQDHELARGPSTPEQCRDKGGAARNLPP